MTCYTPCHGSNLFKIKSICSFHTLCSTSLLQSTVDYSMTWKTGCTYNKLITYFVVNCVKIFWNTTSIYSLSILSRSLSLSRTDFLCVAHWPGKSFKFPSQNILFPGSEVTQVGETVSVIARGLPLPPQVVCKCLFASQAPYITKDFLAQLIPFMIFES